MSENAPEYTSTSQEANGVKHGRGENERSLPSCPPPPLFPIMVGPGEGLMSTNRVSGLNNMLRRRHPQNSKHVGSICPEAGWLIECSVIPLALLGEIVWFMQIRDFSAGKGG